MEKEKGIKERMLELIAEGLSGKSALAVVQVEEIRKLRLELVDKLNYSLVCIQQELGELVSDLRKSPVMRVMAVQKEGIVLPGYIPGTKPGEN